MLRFTLHRQVCDGIRKEDMRGKREIWGGRIRKYM